MKLKILGSYSPIAQGAHNGVGYLIIGEDKEKILLDCGSGSHSMLSVPDDYDGLNIILSHLHKDHFSDLGNIMYASKELEKRSMIENKLSIMFPMTPIDISKIIMDEDYVFGDKSYYNDISNITIGKINVSFLKVEHGKVESYAIKLKEGNKTFVYTGDMSYVNKDAFCEFAQDANVLLCESSLIESENKDGICNHLTAGQAGVIAKDSNAEKLILTHFWCKEHKINYIREAKEEFENVFLADEGLYVLI